MFKISPRLLAAVLSLALARADAAELRLPPVTGELGGVVTRFAVPGAPELKWHLTSTAAAEGAYDYGLTTDADGVHLRVSAHASATGNGTWRIEDSHVEVGPWLAVLAPSLSPSLAGVVAEGTLNVTGGGELRLGQPLGKIQVELSDAKVRNTEQGWSVEGLSLTGEFSFETDGLHWASIGPVQLAAKTISTSRFGARNLTIVATVDDKMVVSLQSAHVEIAGGDITFDPSTIPLSPFAVNVKLHIRRVGLQDLVALVPTGLAAARGRIDGDVEIGWSQAGGVQLGAGNLSLGQDEPAFVRLAATPGLLSGSMPERFVFLPAWTGPLSRWFSPLNPAYAELKSIELGETELVAQSVRVELTPDGDSRGRSAHVQMTARPNRKDSSVERVSFEVDVTGPLSTLLQISTAEHAQLKFN